MSDQQQANGDHNIMVQHASQVYIKSIFNEVHFANNAFYQDLKEGIKQLQIEYQDKKSKLEKHADNVDFAGHLREDLIEIEKKIEEKTGKLEQIEHDTTQLYRTIRGIHGTDEKLTLVRERINAGDPNGADALLQTQELVL